MIDAEAVWLWPGVVSQRAGVAVSTLHYYEQIGLIRSERTAGGRRRYRRDTLRLIAFIRAAQRIGVSLERIRDALDALPHDNPPTVRDWARLARGWRADLDVRIAELVGLRDNLASCIGCGCLSLTSCPYSNPRDVLGQRGPGAHLLRAKARRHTESREGDAPLPPTETDGAVGS